MKKDPLLDKIIRFPENNSHVVLYIRKNHYVKLNNLIRKTAQKLKTDRLEDKLLCVSDKVRYFAQ